ncbi:transcriptional regulator [Pontibacillus chungwhensis BH030062]|uniref:Transcriptional regulator n=1 Tax=Pontibacillus chungwhensis BH030062 TaxID=1385513 RepID=A0A0A2UT69_9BACI|nr:AsnC family transcriptional regulator [Pontibacillus chungwhensis]KGP91492.1 transcriptional regulator [Pontibacillus chungwhensis BH030062]
MSSEEFDSVIDELDKGIIKQLSKNGRMSFAEIASELDVTEKTVRKRYNQMVDNNILEVVGVVNPITIGIKVSAIVQVQVVPQYIDEVITSLTNIPVIRYVTTLTGEYQLLGQVNVRSYEELNETVKKIYQIPHIQSTNVLVQMDVHKNTFEYL